MRIPGDKTINPSGEILGVAPLAAPLNMQPGTVVPVKLAAVSKAILGLRGLPDEALSDDTVTDSVVADTLPTPESMATDLNSALDSLLPDAAAQSWATDGDVLMAQAAPGAGGAGGGGAGVGGAAAGGGIGGGAAMIGGALIVGGAGGGGGSSSTATGGDSGTTGGSSGGTTGGGSSGGTSGGTGGTTGGGSSGPVFKVLTVSEDQRTGEVYEDSAERYAGSGGFAEYGVTSGRVGASADAYTFSAVSAASLKGTYGDFTFNAATGEWTYTINDADADTQALRSGQQAHDYLTVTSTNGFATTIDVTVWGNTDPLPNPPVLTTGPEFSANEDEFLLIKFSGTTGYGPLTYDNVSIDNSPFGSGGSGGSDYWSYSSGGFAVYFAGQNYVYDNTGSDGSSYDTLHYRGEDSRGALTDGSVQINITERTGVDENAPDTRFDLEGSGGAFTFTEGQGTSLAPLFLFDYSSDLYVPDGSGGFTSDLELRSYFSDDAMYTLVLKADNFYNNAYFDIVDTLPEGIVALGDGTSQIALRGHLGDINAFLDNDGVTFYDDGVDYVRNGSGGYMPSFYYDIFANTPGGEDSYQSGYFTPEQNTFNDPGEITISSNYGVATTGEGYPILVIPATSDPNSALVGSTMGDAYIYLSDEEDTQSSSGGGNLAYLHITIEGSATATMTALDSSYADNNWLRFFGDLGSGGDYYTIADFQAAFEGFDATTLYTGVTELDLQGSYYDLQRFATHLKFLGGTGFGVGSEFTVNFDFADSLLNDTGSDGDTVWSHSEVLVRGALANAPTQMTVDLNFVEFADVAAIPVTETPSEPGPTYLSASLYEDQSVSFKGFSVSDADGSGDKMYLSFSTGAFQQDSVSAFGLDRDGSSLFYVDAAYQNLVSGGDFGPKLALIGDGLSLYGTAAELNAALKAGAVHFAPIPDFNGTLQIEVTVTNPDHSDGYFIGDADSRDASGVRLIVDVEAVNDRPVIDGAYNDQIYNEELSGDGNNTYFLEIKGLLYDGPIYDVEYDNGEATGGDLSITSITKLTGAGTLAFVDGDWTYTLTPEELATPSPIPSGGTQIASFSYTVSDGTYTATNVYNLLVGEVLIPVVG